MKNLKQAAIPLVLILFVIVAYTPAINSGFVSDDIGGIVKTAHTWVFPRVAVTETVIHAQMLVWYVLYSVFGLAPWAFRLVNILCHCASVVLVFYIVRTIFERFYALRGAESGRTTGFADCRGISPVRIAFFAALLFAVHPIIIESVTWISGGIYCQYGMLFLLSFYLYLKARAPKKTVWRYLFSSYVVYFVSCLFSEKAFVLFFLFFLYECCFGNLRIRWKKLMPYFILSVFFILMYVVQIPGRLVGVTGMSGSLNAGLYNPLIQLPLSLTTYFQLIVWPKDLAFYHGVFMPSKYEYSIRFCVFLIYSISIIITMIKNRKLCFWLVWFIVPLLPTLTPLKIAWVVAERYAYLSVIGLFVLILYLFEYIMHVVAKRANGDIRTTRFFFAAYILFWATVIGSLFIRTLIRNRDWANEDTLWIATAYSSPAVPYTWNNMGDVYARRGDHQRAAESFLRAISLNPEYAEAYHNLAESYRIMGETGDATLMYEKALSLNPQLWQSHGTLAEIYFRKKDYQTAFYHIEEALKIVPDNVNFLQAREQLRMMVQ